MRGIFPAYITKSQLNIVKSTEWNSPYKGGVNMTEIGEIYIPDTTGSIIICE